MPVLSCPMKVRVRATSSKGSQLQHLPMQVQGDHHRLSYTILVTGQCLQKICEIEVQSSIRHVRVAEKPAVHRLLDHGPDTQNGAEPDHEGLPLLRSHARRRKCQKADPKTPMPAAMETMFTCSAEHQPSGFRRKPKAK